MALSLLQSSTGVTETTSARSATALTNVDVVRMTTRGMTLSEIVRAIREASTTAFDLDPDVIIELEHAGVPIEVIAAMKEIQQIRESPVPLPASAPNGQVELEFVRDKNDSVPKSSAVIFAKDPNGLAIQLAFFITCLEPTHVPDQWQTNTRLRGGFPRHRLLWFHEATEFYKKKFGKELVFLNMSDTTALELPIGVHLLDIGVVARAGSGSWEAIALTQGRLQVWSDKTVHMLVHLSTMNSWLSRRLPKDVSPYTLEIKSIEPPPDPPPSSASQIPDR